MWQDWGCAQWYNHTEKQIIDNQMTKRRIYDQAVLLLGILSKDLKTVPRRDLYTYVHRSIIPKSYKAQIQGPRDI